MQRHHEWELDDVTYAISVERVMQDIEACISINQALYIIVDGEILRFSAWKRATDLALWWTLGDVCHHR